MDQNFSDYMQNNAILTCNLYPFTGFQQLFILVPYYLRNRVPINITWN